MQPLIASNSGRCGEAFTLSAVSASAAPRSSSWPVSAFVFLRQVGPVKGQVQPLRTLQEGEQAGL